MGAGRAVSLQPALAVAALAAALVAPGSAGGAAAVGEPASRIVKPRVVERHIPYGPKRKRQMAAYSQRHYGDREWRLEQPLTIVEHYAVAGSIGAIASAFAVNRPDPELGELPNVCSHYAVSGSGRIVELVDPSIRCRHTVGLNHVAIGIEHTGFSDAQVLGNRRQMRASVRLTSWLRCRFGIPVRDVIGHNESLRSPYRLERVRSLRDQTHGDFRRASMRRYRAALSRAPECPPPTGGVRPRR